MKLAKFLAFWVAIFLALPFILAMTLGAILGFLFGAATLGWAMGLTLARKAAEHAKRD
jgi:hypothetical protein